MADAAAGTPGKRSLVEESGGVHAAAARGIAGPATSLPYLDVIQRSFGAGHDLSGVKAHVGGSAEEATGAMGASAYATGDHVAFSGAPDLHTAAHEAAHVVQQARGVSLYGGVGQEGDEHERNADAVADRVVAGESAADLLGGGGGGGGAAVQQKGKGKGKKKHENGGYSKYGGPSVREYLSELVEQGKLDITGQQVAVLDAVAQVETGGKIGCVQTYDDQIVSVGFKQVVLGHGSLEKMMKKAPDGFARHGLSLDTSKKYTHPGWKNKPSQIVGCEDENELRKPEWGDKFYAASLEPDVVIAMCALALGEAKKVDAQVAKQAPGTDLFADTTAQAWLLETINNRPAFMPVAIQKAVAAGAKSAKERDAFLDILAKAIVDAYIEQEPILHYKKAKEAKEKKGAKLTAEQDAALLAEKKVTYEPIGKKKGTNIVTKIKRNLVVPKLGEGGGGGGAAVNAPAKASAGGGDAAATAAQPAAQISSPADEAMMSMPVPELVSMPVEPEALVCLPGEPVEGMSSDGGAAVSTASAQEPAEPEWVTRARAYNREHAGQVQQFVQATHGACLGADGEIDPAEAARWQSAHGLEPDGRIGPRSVKAAVGGEAAKAPERAAAVAAPAGASASAGAGAGAGAKDAAGAGQGEGFFEGLWSAVTDLARPVLDLFSGGDAQVESGGGGGGGGGGGHAELPVPEHGDDMEAAEKVEQKPAGAKPKSPNAPAKAVGREVYKEGGILSKEHLHQYKLSDQEFAFKLRVYDAATGRLGDKIYGGVPEGELTSTENGKEIRKDVAGPLSNMLAAMRADMAAGKAVGDKEVGKATGISITSAYRSPQRDRDLWDQYFQGYLAATADDRAATGDPFGAESVKLIVKYIGSRKAPPGGSNHSNGTAVDLSIEEGGHRKKNSYNNQTAWRKSWQYAWLNANAASHGFKNYPKEAWHWDYKG